MKRAVGYQDVVSSGTRLVGTICAVFCVFSFGVFGQVYRNRQGNNGVERYGLKKHIQEVRYGVTPRFGYTFRKCWHPPVRASIVNTTASTLCCYQLSRSSPGTAILNPVLGCSTQTDSGAYWLSECKTIA